jgi:hypothetical protein
LNASFTFGADFFAMVVLLFISVSTVLMFYALWHRIAFNLRKYGDVYN